MGIEAQSEWGPRYQYDRVGTSGGDEEEGGLAEGDAVARVEVGVGRRNSFFIPVGYHDQIMGTGIEIHITYHCH